MDKQVWDIRPEDLAEFPVWHFPTDETVEDEATVRPIRTAEELKTYVQIIVSTRFRTASGRVYSGFVYWLEPEYIYYLKPVLFAGSVSVTFWNGIREPGREYAAEVRAALGEDAFPIEFESLPVYGLKVIKGTLEGLYYIGPWGDTCWRM